MAKFYNSTSEIKTNDLSLVIYGYEISKGLGDPSKKVMEIPGDGGSTVKPPGMEILRDGGQTGYEPSLRVWIFSGTTHKVL